MAFATAASFANPIESPFGYDPMARYTDHAGDDLYEENEILEDDSQVPAKQDMDVQPNGNTFGDDYVPLVGDDHSDQDEETESVVLRHGMDVQVDFGEYAQRVPATDIFLDDGDLDGLEEFVASHPNEAARPQLEVPTIPLEAPNNPLGAQHYVLDAFYQLLEGIVVESIDDIIATRANIKTIGLWSGAVFKVSLDSIATFLVPIAKSPGVFVVAGHAPEEMLTGFALRTQTQHLSENAMREFFAMFPTRGHIYQAFQVPDNVMQWLVRSSTL
ncbi:hypothetical protein GGF31_003467 [Allomyces arbusculus]|nr:hypothetical protein GGF31_003467 [Allomyces arbusculus]